MEMQRKLYLLKFGGNTVSDTANMGRLFKEVARLVSDGYGIVIVHGGGREISAEMERRGLEPEMVNGQRRTDEAALDCVETVLRAINGRLVEALEREGLRAVGMPAYFFTESKRREPFKVVADGMEAEVDMGLLGEVVDVDPRTVYDIVEGGVVPVIYPVGSDGATHLNVNADAMAAGIAAGTKCTEMIAITDVPGILRDVHDPSSKIDRVTLEDIDALIADGTISGGMIPKVEACRKAVLAGAKAVRMVDGKAPGNIISDVFAGKPRGTLIVKRIQGTEMDFNTVKDLSSRYLFQNYGRLDLCFESGEGCYLTDLGGKRYLDAVAGIAVCSLGYSHPEWVKAMRDQVSHLVHASNLYYVKEQALLAQKLAAITPEPIARTLFCNSGAEANEGAMKTAVKYTGRHKVMAAMNGFHGRTSASLGATGQTKYQSGFEPLISDCYRYYGYNDLESVKGMIGRDTACLLIEGIQGEGGVRMGDPDFLKGVRDLCTDTGTIMIVDEVQTGMGRTGKWWCMDNYGIAPDIITAAKGLAAGMPIGAIMTTDEIAEVMTPGTHGTTFGGNPLVCASGCAVIDIITRNGILDNVTKVGAEWKDELAAVDSPRIRDVRGLGFIMGVEMDSPETADAVRAGMIEEGVLANVCHGNTVRIIPPLIFSGEEKDVFMNAFERALGRRDRS